MSHEPRLSLALEHEAIERALDALGQADRASMPPGFEERIAASSVSVLAAHAAAPTVGPVPSSEESSLRLRHPAGRVPRQAGQSRRRYAIAAGLGAIACATATWLALRGQSGPVQTPQDPVAQGAPAPDGSAIALNGPAIDTDSDTEFQAMLLASSLLGDGLDQELASISADAASLGLDLTDPVGGQWSDSEWSGESL